MTYPDYLVHFNQNHSSKNGQFISGDGDGDGISNDHANQGKKKERKPITQRQAKVMNTNSKKNIKSGAVMLGVATGLAFVSRVSSAIAYETDSNIASGIAFATASSAISLGMVGTTKVATGVGNNIRSNVILRRGESK